MPELKIEQIIDYIYNDEIAAQDKKIVYFAIGSAHHMARVGPTGQRIIDEQYDQQYPIFMRELNQKYPEFLKYIILIDPMLEKPCFTVANKFVEDAKENPLDKDWYVDDDFENIYHNTRHNIQIFEYRVNVNYSKQEMWNPPSSININPQINSLIEMSKMFKWFTVVMEYTGRNLNGLANIYDPVIGSDKDHIFFGLPTRVDGGCYIDLSDKTAKFVPSMEKGYLTAFTSFNYTNDELFKIYTEVKSKDDEDSIIIASQIMMSFQNIVKVYKDSVLALFRRIITNHHNIKSGKEAFEFYPGEIEYISNKYNIDSFNEKAKHRSEELMSQVGEICDKEFLIIAYYFNRNDTLAKYYELREIVEPFKMYQEISKLVKEICPL